jgi:hypothetical protein
MEELHVKLVILNNEDFLGCHKFHAIAAQRLLKKLRPIRFP